MESKSSFTTTNRCQSESGTEAQAAQSGGRPSKNPLSMATNTSRNWKHCSKTTAPFRTSRPTLPRMALAISLGWRPSSLRFEVEDYFSSAVEVWHWEGSHEESQSQKSQR